MHFDWTITMPTIMSGAGAVFAVIIAGWRMVSRICDRLYAIETGNNRRLESIETSSMMMEARLEDIARRINRMDRMDDMDRAQRDTLRVTGGMYEHRNVSGGTDG